MAKNKSQSGSGNGESKPRAPKGPELGWDEQRDYALAVAVAGGVHNTSDLATQLAGDPAFSDVPAGAITASKIRLRLANLRKKGAVIPQFGRGRGYTPDISAINGLFGVVAPSAQ